MTVFTPKHDYLVGIDSDGCAFDTMELKHKECFIPVTIRCWGLQGVSKCARETAEFLNLHSKNRGINRFPALVELLRWVNARLEVKARGIQVEIPPSLLDWLRDEPSPSNFTLEKEVQRTQDPALQKTLAWSQAVDAAVEQMVRGVPPFALVRESLQKLQGFADILVVSVAPGEVLLREWEEHDLARCVTAISGQDSGTKEELLRAAADYPPNHAMMIGDSPGDHRAASANNVLFFPINPGGEEASWQRFYEEGIDRFLSGRFAGAYQASLLAEFDRCLPEVPPWGRGIRDY